MGEKHHLAQAAQPHGLLKIARDLELPEAFAVEIFEVEVQRLRVDARVERFVAILAEKRAMELLRATAKRLLSSSAPVFGKAAAADLPAYVPGLSGSAETGLAMTRDVSSEAVTVSN